MFKPLPLCVSKGVEMETMPDCFEPHYPDTRVIVDCTELFIQMPSSLRALVINLKVLLVLLLVDL